jgi:hypothetical protein
VSPDPPADTPASADDEIGEPVTELSGLSYTVTGGFRSRVRRGIERRRLTGDVLDFICAGPSRVLFELFRAPFELLSGDWRRKDGQ